MKINILAAITLTSLIVLSCNTQKSQEETSEQSDTSSVVEQEKAVGPVSSITSKYQRTIRLENGFEIQVGDEEDFQRFKTYTLFKLSRNGSVIYMDSSLTEYEFGDEKYPLVLPFGREKFEVLVEVNDRPNKNYLKLFRIESNKLIEVQQLPTFISYPSDLDSDGKIEYAGFWDYPQVSGDETAYNPILYYQLTDDGLKLDSTLTIGKNTMIYGKFSGYKFTEAVIVPTSTFQAYEAEVKRIEAKRE
jgi:hypothetical protein